MPSDPAGDPLATLHALCEQANNDQTVAATLRWAAAVLRDKYGEPTDHGAGRTLDFYAHRVDERDFDV